MTVDVGRTGGSRHRNGSSLFCLSMKNRQVSLRSGFNTHRAPLTYGDSAYACASSTSLSRCPSTSLLVCRCGPVQPTSAIEGHDGGHRRLMLRVYPSGRREDIGKIRDGGTYFSGFLQAGMPSHLPRRNYRDGADVEKQTWGQINWCSMAARVAVAREVTSSLL